MTTNPEKALVDEPKNPPQMATNDSLGASLPEGSARSQALLENLRRQGLFCDAIIAVADKEFPVHRAVVSHLSSFFFKSFTGDFSEAESRKLTIKGASSDALSVVLDFAYGVDVSTSLGSDWKLASEVWKLAHRFDICELVDISGCIAVEGATVENSVHLFSQASMFECDEEREIMFMFIAQRFFEVSRDCDDFKYIMTALEIEEFLASEELIANEVEKYDCIKAWCISVPEESREQCLDDLLSYVHLELMPRSDLQRVLQDADFLPKSVLCKALEANLNAGVCIPGVHLGGIYSVEKKLVHTGSDFALPLGKRTGEFFPKLLPPFRFMCHRWVMVAWTEVRLGHIFLVLRFEQRHSGTHEYSRLAEDISNFSFDMASKVVSEKNDPFDTVHHSRLSSKNKTISVKVLKRADTRISDGGHDSRGNLTLLVNLRYRRSPKKCLPMTHVSEPL